MLVGNNFIVNFEKVFVQRYVYCYCDMSVDYKILIQVQLSLHIQCDLALIDLFSFVTETCQREHEFASSQ